MSLVDCDDVYSFAKKFHENEPYSDFIKDIDCSSIALTLRPFQVSAVKWMLYKEKCSENNKVNVIDIHVDLPKGGILADEMGLGKTIEVLALILNNPCPNAFSNKRKCLSDHKGLNFKENYKLKQTECITLVKRSSNQLLKLEQEENSDIIEPKKTKFDSVDEVIEEVIKKYSSPKKTGLASEKYQMLRTFYETSLNSVSARPRTATRGENILKCFCDGNGDMEQICCHSCSTNQHKSCVGIEDDFEDEDYFCPPCLAKKKPINSRATFIITPISIVSQWECEIKKHITAPDFKVYIYNGVKKNTYIQPKILASYDVVITTYAVLCKELNYTNGISQSDRKLRHAKRFHSVTSPLTCIRWWRICLDEAQMVESYQTKTALMAQVLEAEFRWAVTGTPIQKSIYDLYGLIQFLKINNFDLQTNWLDLVLNKEELNRFVAHILWRSCKKDILHMLEVPKQNVVHHWLRFSPVEGYFYQRTHKECSYYFKHKVVRRCRDLNVTLKSLDRNIVDRVLNPLLKLRQACTHPQAVRGKFLKFKHTLTMEELLTAMVAKAKLDVEVSLRQYVSELNGIAGLHIILHNWAEAVTHYRHVLQLNQEYDDLPTVKVDSLQMIHALHNLAEVLESNSGCAPPTLRDDKLHEDVQALEQAYIKKYEVAVLSAKEYLAKSQATISKLCNGGTLGFSKWWVNLINWVEDPNELLHRIRVHLDNNVIPGQVSLSYKLTNLPGVLNELATWLANIDRARIDTIEALRRLELRPLSEIAESALNCHLRQKKSQRKKKCLICKCEAVLLRYEVSIFSINKRNILEEFDDELPLPLKSDNKIVEDLKSITIMKSKKEGSWKPSQTEQVLQVLANFARFKRAPNEWVEDASKHTALMENIRKEFKWLRACWGYISDQVAARDELSMAKVRLSLLLPEEEDEIRKKKKSDPHLILPHDVPEQLEKLEKECIVSEMTLKKHVGILLYLQNLQKNDKSEKDPCPVCREVLNDQWSVLNCGHCFCFVCIPTLLRMGSSLHMECAVCRVKTAKADVSYVVSGKPKDEGTNYNVKGSHSTKIEAVVSELIKLKEEDPTVKVLIFSTWEKVLEVIGEALTLNSISFRQFGVDPKSRKGLLQFKTGSVTALLLPLRFGCKGLNLIEATHVFLVEPILNPADELQAIGRLHRIGQTKETFVHRFVIRNTIEERMLTCLISSDASEWTNNNITVLKLYDLFSDSNVNEDVTIESGTVVNDP